MITAVSTPQVQDISPVDAIWTIIQSQTKAVRQAIYLRVEAEQKQAKARDAISAMRRQSEGNGNAELTLDEINDEIRLAREARRK